MNLVVLWVLVIMEKVIILDISLFFFFYRIYFVMLFLLCLFKKVDFLFENLRFNEIVKLDVFLNVDNF